MTALSEDLESTQQFAQQSQQEPREPDQIDEKDELDGDTEEEGHEQVLVKSPWIRSVEPPTPEEQETHRRTHLPFASWYRICVASKGRV